MAAKTISQAFGKVLRECRMKSGISQEDLAVRADLDRTYVSMLERGVRQPTLDTVFRLANVLGVSAGTMVTRTAAVVG